MPFIKLSSWATHKGITRWIPNIAESDAIKYGTLTEEEKVLYRAIFYRRTATKAMLNEAKIVELPGHTKESIGIDVEGEDIIMGDALILK